MRGSRWLASPLTGTAAVLAGLCLLAIPLRKLTSETPAPPPRPAPAASASMEIPAVLRLKLLAPAKRVTLKTAEAKVILELENPAAGESEHDAVIPFDGKRTELTLAADLGDALAETAVFLTIMPDGYEDQTCYAIGRGAINETLSYDWHSH